MRLLLLTRHYPPEVSGGARRPLGFVQGLRAAGVDVTLCGPVGIDDPQLIGVPHPVFPAIPAGVTATGAMPLTAKIANVARRRLLWPDPEIRWAMRAVKAVKASGQHFDWIMTTSPPESLHVAGRALQRHFGCRWVADVRDMWIASPQRPELQNAPVRQAIERRIARATLGHADALVAVSEAVMAEMRLYAKAHVPEAIIGHFAMSFDGPAEELPKDRWNIVHTGAVSLSNPLSEFSVLLSDFEGLMAARPRALLWLAGNISALERALIDASSARDHIKILGPVSMARARALQLGADALALVSGRTSHALPGKFSEYVQSGKPILISAPGPWVGLIPPDAPVFTFQDAATWDKAATLSQIMSETETTATAQLLVHLAGR